jgi:nucleotide-binding universal stress UspA family protein
MSVTESLVGTAVFLAASFTFGKRIVFYLIRWSNDSFQTEFPVITTILVIMGVMALITHFLGVHTVLGAFVAGVLIGQSPILTGHIDEQLRGLIVAFFMPVFFGVAGLSTDLTVLANPPLLALAMGLIVIASMGKFAGAFIGGWMGGLDRREAFALGCGMNARGSTEVIVASVGLSMGALTQNLFTMIVAMAFVTTMAMPPMLRWALARVPMTDEERERLEREEFEEKGFVTNLERLLLAADESPNGKFAARLAGFLAGQLGAPTTVLPLEPPSPAPKTDEAEQADAKPEPVTSKDVVRAAAESARSQDEEDNAAPSVAITVREPDKPADEAVAAEAKKGYDLLFIGKKSMQTKSGAFPPDIARIVSAFDGPTALVIGRDATLKEPQQYPNHILVPIAGTDVSRRAAEVAIAIASACNCPVTALYVATTGPNSKRRGRTAREQERAIVEEIAAIAKHYDVTLSTETNSSLAPDKAIVKLAKSGEQDLIIMGVSRRSGERLFFGDTVATVFQEAPISIMFVAS